MITLYGTVRQGEETRPTEATGDDYAVARAALDELVPEGWQLLGISRWLT